MIQPVSDLNCNSGSVVPSTSVKTCTLCQVSSSKGRSLKPVRLGGCTWGSPKNNGSLLVIGYVTAPNIEGFPKYPKP